MELVRSSTVSDDDAMTVDEEDAVTAALRSELLESFAAMDADDDGAVTKAEPGAGVSRGGARARAPRRGPPAKSVARAG